MGKKRKAPPQPSPVDSLQERALAYRDGRELIQAGSDRLDSVRAAVTAGDWGRALVEAFNLGEYCAGVEHGPTVLQLMQTEIDLLPFENNARRQAAAQRDQSEERKTARNNAVRAAYLDLPAEQRRTMLQKRLVQKLVEMTVVKATPPDKRVGSRIRRSQKKDRIFKASSVRDALADLMITAARRKRGEV